MTDRFKILLLLGFLWLPGLATPWLAEGLDGLEALSVVLLSLFVLAVPLCLLPRWRSYFLLWLPLAPLIPAYLYLCHYYRSVPGDVLMSAALNTRWQDSVQMVASFGWKLCWVPVLGAVYAVIALSIGREARWPWRRPLLAALLTYAMAGMLGQQVLVQWLPWPPLFDLQTAKLVFPVNLALSAEHSWDRQRQLDTRASVSGRSGDDGPLLVVLVVGESVRRDHLGLYGYERPTTPWLTAHASEFAIFRDVASTAQWTEGAVPRIVTQESAAGAATLVQTFAEAGFRTAWLSNQEPSKLSREADVVDHSENGQDKYFRKDMSLLPLMVAFNHQAGPRQFVVLHMMGSHFHYDERYTAASHRFRPTLTEAGVSGQPDLAHRAEAVNSYDNTVVELDRFMERTIALLEAESRPVVLLYTSDHGDNLLDDESAAFMHARPTPTCHDLKVPLLVWGNAAYRERHAQRFAAVQANTARRVSHVNVFASLLELGGVDWSGRDASWSFASPAFTERDRPLTDLYARGAKTYEALCAPAAP